MKSLRVALFLATALSGLTGCVLPSDDTVDNNPAPLTPVYGFGSSYSVIQSDSLPRLEGDSLYVEIGYECTGGADLTLEHFKTTDSTYEVWLNMDRGAFPTCIFPIVEKRAFKIPDAVKNAQSVQLVTPGLQRIE